MSFRKLTETIPEIIYRADPITFQATYINPAVERIFGYSPQEWLADPELRVKSIHPDDREGTLQRLRDAAGERESAVLEYRIVRRDGEIRWLNDHLGWEKDGNGNLISASGVVLDVTEKKQTGDLIRKSEQEWRSILDAVADYVLIVDGQHRVQRVNRLLADRLDMHPKDIVGSPCYVLVHGSNAPPECCQLKSTLSCDLPSTGLLRNMLVGDYVECSFSLMKSTGQGKRVVHILRDVSAQKKLEKEIAEAADKERQRIGRDLNEGLAQTLTGIALLCKSLEDRLRNTGLQEAVELSGIRALMDKTIDTARTLATDISPVESGPDGLETALREFSVRIEDQFPISCDFVCPRAVPIQSNYVATHLYQIAQEAVLNAIKDRNTAHIAIMLNCVDDTVFLSVENDGGRFRKKGNASSGLGMESIIYRAKMIGAELAIERKTNGGAIVSVKLGPLLEPTG